MLHRALLGSLERFFGVLIEHYAGAFPLWLAPVQAVVDPGGRAPAGIRAARWRRSCARAGVRVHVDDRSEKMGYKIREAQVQKVPYMLVVGDKEVEAGERGLRAPPPCRRPRVHGRRRVSQDEGRARWRPRASGAPRNSRRQPWRCLIDNKTVRINDRIRAKEVRVIDDDGAQLGIMPPAQALMIAEEKGLDLVEIAATATPPVCRIMNSGKFFYQQAKRESEARKHQRHIQVKEVKFRPKIDEHDFQFKKRNVERFLLDGNKVKSTVIFRGREMAHNEIGRRILNRLAAELTETALVEVLSASGRHDDGADPRAQEGSAPKKARPQGQEGREGEEGRKAPRRAEAGRRPAWRRATQRAENEKTEEPRS